MDKLEASLANQPASLRAEEEDQIFFLNEFKQEVSFLRLECCLVYQTSKRTDKDHLEWLV